MPPKELDRRFLDRVRLSYRLFLKENNIIFIILFEIFRNLLLSSGTHFFFSIIYKNLRKEIVKWSLEHDLRQLETTGEVYNQQWTSLKTNNHYDLNYPEDLYATDLSLNCKVTTKRRNNTESPDKFRSTYKIEVRRPVEENQGKTKTLYHSPNHEM